MKGLNPIWLRFAAVLVLVAGIVAACEWTPIGETVNLGQLSAWLSPHRHAWYALPIVLFVYVTLGLALVPVLLLVAATGIAFGPWLGPVYAMAGCLASASTGFAIGRRVGFRRIEKIGGPRVTRVGRALKRNGLLAIFLLRKVPAPFMLANIVAGASSVRYRDFVAGTVLGMGAFVVALAGFGHHLMQAFRNPSPLKMLGAAIMVGLPLALAWFINRQLGRRRRDPSLEALVDGDSRAS